MQSLAELFLYSPTDKLDHSFLFTVKLYTPPTPAYPSMRIHRVTVTTSQGTFEPTADETPIAKAGETITIRVYFEETAGNGGSIWGKIIDFDTKEVVGRKKTLEVDPYETGYWTWSLTMPDRDWHLECQIGHVE